MPETLHKDHLHDLVDYIIPWCRIPAMAIPEENVHESKKSLVSYYGMTIASCTALRRLENSSLEWTTMTLQPWLM